MMLKSLGFDPQQIFGVIGDLQRVAAGIQAQQNRIEDTLRRVERKIDAIAVRHVLDNDGVNGNTPSKESHGTDEQ